MLYFNRWKVIAILAVSAAAILFSLPNAFSPAQLQNLPGWMQMRMPLGLDLQGGSYLLFQMDADELRKGWLENLTGDVRKVLRDGKIGYSGLATAKDEVRVTIRKADQAEDAYAKLKALSRPSMAIFGQATTDVDVAREGNVITLKPTVNALNERIGNAIGSAIEIVRNRIDPTGTRELTIQRQGRDRILLQVPGLKDSTELKKLVGETAKLTFQLVDTSMTAEEARTGNPPPGAAVYKAKPGTEDEYGERYYLLQKAAIVSGSDLVDAKPDFDDRNNEPVVSFRFNTSGAQRFARTTEENVGKPFAIVLDGEVISAPVIREPIRGGSGQISGNFTVESAARLALLLRSGALPAKLTVADERSVGASLGKDAIEAGGKATLIAFFAVTVFMVAGYGFFGAISVIALIVNVAIIVACLSLMQATLTLPGIAGIALTMGVAVDANVLIYERMREELRSGKSNILALEAGFSRAYGTIIDSHLTGLLGGLILMALGSGPIKGFAVTLCIGTVASLFTAITLTRLIIASWVRWARPAVIPL